LNASIVFAHEKKIGSFLMMAVTEQAGVSARKPYLLVGRIGDGADLHFASKFGSHDVNNFKSQHKLKTVRRKS
jgi:hypothetical protein